MTVPVQPAAHYVRQIAPRPAPDGRFASTADPPLTVSQAGLLAGEWPLRSFLDLAALDAAVPSARLHVRHMLQQWDLAALAEDAELVMSELVTNGVQASRAMTHAAIRVWLASDYAQVMICTWDASPRPPVRMDPAPDAEHGRGLLLVGALSKRWGWLPAGPVSPQAGSQHGKVVWAVIS